MALDVWAFEGPVAALEVQRTGIAFAAARGLTEMVEWTMGGTLLTSIDAGHLDDVLAIAGRLGAGPGTANTPMVQITASVAAIRLQVMRGHASEVANWLDGLQTVARDTRDPQEVVMALACTASAWAALDRPDVALTVLAEVESLGGARSTAFYAPALPGMVRTALTLGDLDHAHRLVSGVEPRIPYVVHALAGAGAALAEADDDLPGAIEKYADAAQRWNEFGVLPEEAFALLGQGRCLLRLGRPAHAAAVLDQARVIFEQLGAAPALADTDVLLAAKVANS